MVWYNPISWFRKAYEENATSELSEREQARIQLRQALVLKRRQLEFIATIRTLPVEMKKRGLIRRETTFDKPYSM